VIIPRASRRRRPKILSSLGNYPRTLATTRSLYTATPCGRAPRGGRTPFNITTPRYDGRTTRGVLGFPQVSYTGTRPHACPHGKQTPVVGFPEDYLPWPFAACRPAQPARRAFRQCRKMMDYTLQGPLPQHRGADAPLICSLASFIHWLHGGSSPPFFVSWHTALGRQVVAETHPCLRRFCTDLLHRVRRKQRTSDSDSGPEKSAGRE